MRLRNKYADMWRDLGNGENHSLQKYAAWNCEDFWVFGTAWNQMLQTIDNSPELYFGPRKKQVMEYLRSIVSFKVARDLIVATELWVQILEKMHKDGIFDYWESMEVVRNTLRALDEDKTYLELEMLQEASVALIQLFWKEGRGLQDWWYYDEEEKEDSGEFKWMNNIHLTLRNLEELGFFANVMKFDPAVNHFWISVTSF